MLIRRFVVFVLVLLVSTRVTWAQIAPHAEFSDGNSISISTAQTYFASTGADSTTYTALNHSTRSINTTDEDLSDLIRITARGLNYDPERIFEFVRNNIEVHPVFGESKGAYGALIDMEGTAFDQSRLAMLLLQESDGKNGRNISAKIQIGNVSLTPEQWESWMGFSGKKSVCRFLANGGIPNSLSDCTSLSGELSSNLSIGYSWLEVTIDGVSEAWDVAYKKRTLFHPLSELSAKARNNAQSPLQKILVSANTGNDAASDGSRTEQVSFIQSPDVNGLESDLNSASLVLDGYLKESVNYSYPLKEMVGGYVIDSFAQSIDKSPLVSYSSWNGSGYNDVPDKFRIFLDIRVSSVSYPAHPDYPGHVSELLIQERIAVDEVYGRLFRLRTRPQCNDMGVDDVFSATGSYCLMLSVGAESIASTTRNALILLPGNTNKQTPGDKKNVDIFISYNHPYPTSSSAGSFQDGNISKRVSLFSDTIIVNAWGRTSADMISTWNNRLGLDGSVPGHGEPCGLSDPSETGNYSCIGIPKASNVIRHKLTASYMAQNSKFMDLLQGLSGANITHHRTIGFVYGTHIVKELNSALLVGTGGGEVATEAPYFASADDSIFFDIRPSLSISSRILQIDEAAVKRSYAVISASLEGLVFKHVMGALDEVTTGSKFAWAATMPPRDTDGPEKVSQSTYVDDPDAPFNPVIPKYYLFNSTNYWPQGAASILKEDNYNRLPLQFFANLPHPKTLANQQLMNYIASDYSVVIPSETFLGPGPRKGTVIGVYTQQLCPFRGASGCVPYPRTVNNPHPSRGSALVAWTDDTNKIALAVVRRFGVQKGGGVSGAPGDFALPSLPKTDKFIDPAAKIKTNYSINPQTGTMSYDYDALSVGNASAGNALSVSYSFSSGDKSPDFNQWKNNWHMQGNISSSGLEALGVSRADNAVGAIVAIEALLSNYSTPATSNYEVIAREVAGPLIMNWWGKQTENNTFTFVTNSSASTYVRKVDGSYNPPSSKPNMKLIQSGEPFMIESIPLPPPNSEQLLPLKSVHSRKWDYQNVNFILMDEANKIVSSFARSFGPPVVSAFENPLASIDPVGFISEWNVSSIDMIVGADITISSSHVSNDRGQRLDFNAIAGTSATDEYGRITTNTNPLSPFPKQLVNAKGNVINLEYTSGKRVQEGVVMHPFEIGEQTGNYTIVPTYLYEYPFVGIKKIYEPGQVPGTDTPMATIEYDKLGRISSVTDSEGRRTSYGQAMGRMTSVIDNAGNETISKYDEYGRLIELIEPSYEGDAP